MFLGFMLGAISVQGTLKGPAAIALSVPVLILGLVFFDTVFAIRAPLLAGTAHLRCRQRPCPLTACRPWA